MSKKKSSKAAVAPAGGPVLPGTPLYRILEMVAREVAHSLEKHPDEGKHLAKPTGQ